MNKIFIIIVLVATILIIAGVLAYFLMPDFSEIKFGFLQKTEKPTPPPDIPMSVLAPLDPDAEKAVIRVENFKP